MCWGSILKLAPLTTLAHHCPSTPIHTDQLFFFFPIVCLHWSTSTYLHNCLFFILSRPALPIHIHSWPLLPSQAQLPNNSHHCSLKPIIANSRSSLTTHAHSSQSRSSIPIRFILCFEETILSILLLQFIIFRREKFYCYGTISIIFRKFLMQ